jgi:hypothetical protein
MSYKLTINANICFDYYPYSKTTSEEVPYIISKEEINFYDEWHDVELEIAPKMLLECLDFVYKYDKGEQYNLKNVWINWFCCPACENISDNALEELSYTIGRN